MERAYEKFLRYVVVDTQSADDSDTVPTTEKQKDLARLLAAELSGHGGLPGPHG